MFVHLSTHVHDVFIAATIAQAYTIRENFREANMLLGIDAMEVYEFYSQLEKEKPTTQNHFFYPTKRSFTGHLSLMPQSRRRDIQNCIISNLRERALPSD